MTIARTRILLFSLFVASGFTGLIYESIWSHYLKHFLGHAAYAQALVLAIFMGGMAIGAWLTGKHLSKWSNLLVIYAAIECLVGVLGVGFHQIFEYVTAVSFDQIIPSLESPKSVHIYKWTTAAALILPQSILLGMTFPLMSNGLIRLLPDTKGATLSMLYFCNSIGAAIGVLVSGFYLIEALGLPGTILTAGLLNILLAIIVYGATKSHKVTVPEYKADTNSSNLPIFFLFAAFITGAASFIYELAWIRMLSMVLGASTHSFELMLSAFITGLAFGGLWISRHIDKFKAPIQVGGYIQILMGIFALATIPFYNVTFDLMGYFIQALKNTAAGYQLYTFSSHLLALLVMLPATFCAGMTLPLFTYILLKRNYGEKSIGYTYASNTLGAIVGVAFTIFIGLPVLGIKNSLLLGASLDIVLGLSLIIFFAPQLKIRSFAAPAIIVFSFFVSIIVWSDFDERRMASGVFRKGNVSISDNSQVIFHKDGKTASISVTKDGDNVAIMTNGKPDASIYMSDGDSISHDEFTMMLAALIPLSIQPETQTVANIGFGSGLTTHTILASPTVKQVDTIEIESAIIEGANKFRPRVERAYSDERSRIYIEDAKTFFSTYKKKYDLIISEPSNPWVSGVSSLFSKEFYHRITRHLEKDGMLVQWVHLYELNPSLVFSILKALSLHFSNFSIYLTNNLDMIIIAGNGGAIKQPTNEIFKHESVKNELALLSLNNVNDINARFIGNNETFLPLINYFNIGTNSDYFPVLDLNAPRARFFKSTAGDVVDIIYSPLPITKMLLPHFDQVNSEELIEPVFYRFTNEIINARKLVDYINKSNLDEDLTGPGIVHLDYLMRLAKTCEAHMYPERWINNFHPLMTIVLPHLQEHQLTTVLNAVSPDCEDNKMTEQQIAWINLYKSFMKNDAKEVVKHSNFLLENSEDTPEIQRQYLFAAHMLGLVTLKTPEAQLFWLDNLEKSYHPDRTPMWLRMLYFLSLTNYQ